MKRSHFTTEQIVFASRQAELGKSVAEVCRKMGIVEQTFYRWKRKYIWKKAKKFLRLLYWVTRIQKYLLEKRHLPFAGTVINAV